MAYQKLVDFKEHLKVIVKLIVEDVHNNFEAYKVTNKESNVLPPYNKVMLSKSSAETERY